MWFDDGGLGMVFVDKRPEVGDLVLCGRNPDTQYVSRVIEIVDGYVVTIATKEKLAYPHDICNVRVIRV